MSLTPARKTYAQLTAAADMQDADLLASYRSTGPLKKVTASTAKTYFQTGVALSATLAATGGAALIGTADGGTVQGSLANTLRSVGFYGALTPPATAATTFANAVATLGRGADLFIQDPLNVGTAYVENDNVEIHGNAVYYNNSDGGGNRPINYWGRERWTHFGREQLARLYFLLDTGAAVSIGMVGDSNTEAYVGPVLAALLGSVSGVTVVNYGVSATTEDQWLNETGPFAPGQPADTKGFSSVVAAGHDLIINGYGGTNDPAFGRTVDQALTTKRLALEAIRSSVGGTESVGILQMTANTQNDGAANRDPLFLSNFNAGVRQIVQDPSIAAAFFDKTAEFPDPFPDFAVSGFQNKWLDSARVHPAFAHITLLAQFIYEWLIPNPYRAGGTFGQVTPGTGFTLPSPEKMFAAKSGSIVTGGGYVTQTTPAPLSVGQVVATLPAGYRPADRAIVMLALFNNAATPLWEYNIPAQVLSNGTITVDRASTQSPQRVYLMGSWSTVNSI